MCAPRDFRLRIMRHDEVPSRAGSPGINNRNSAVAATAPSNSATTKPGASAGRIPTKVSLAARAVVTAGFANDVEVVNQ
jgi:hypothetical protein